MQKKNLQPVENSPGWYRDPSSGAIVRKDSKARELYRQQKDKINKRKEAEQNREERVACLESKVDKLTELLEEVLRKDKY